VGVRVQWVELTTDTLEDPILVYVLDAIEEQVTVGVGLRVEGLASVVDTVAVDVLERVGEIVAVEIPHRVADRDAPRARTQLLEQLVQLLGAHVGLGRADDELALLMHELENIRAAEPGLGDGIGAYA